MQMKDEGWWLVLGNPKTSELHALKRTSFVTSLTTKLAVPLNAERISEVLFVITL
jgi:hypothetical protein